MSKEISLSDDESQAKPHTIDLKQYIKESDEESSDQLTPKSSPQKPKVKRKKKLTKHNSDLKQYIKVSDEESSDQLTPKSSPQKPKVKRKKKLTKHNSPITRTNKTISQEITQKNLIPESELRNLRKKSVILGADSLDYSRRKNYKYVVEYKDKKIHFGSIKTDDCINHHDHVPEKSTSKRLNKLKTKMGN